ncbi:L,D-transpeptidase [Paenibacillus sp. P26]|nr:L,D-transpeptidase [Paenibacillus sp. P26]
MDPAAHRLQLEAGQVVLADASIGAGREGHRTPEGEYTIGTRVRSPQGKRPGVYGDAALGMGDLAIHGTSDPDSIGKDASLGCIRVGDADMAKLFQLTPRGTQVLVSRGALRDTGRATDSSSLPAFPERQRAGETAGMTVFHWLG